MSRDRTASTTPPSRLGFPLHAVAVTVPIGALVCSTMFDVGSHAAEAIAFGRSAFWLLVFGSVGAFAAGAVALVALLRLPRGSDAYRVGCWHVALTDLALVAYVASALLRRGHDYTRPVAAAPLATSAVGLALLAAGTVAGARLTYRYGIGVEGGSPTSRPE